MSKYKIGEYYTGKIHVLRKDGKFSLCGTACFRGNETRMLPEGEEDKITCVKCRRMIGLKAVSERDLLKMCIELLESMDTINVDPEKYKQVMEEVEKLEWLK